MNRDPAPAQMGSEAGSPSVDLWRTVVFCLIAVALASATALVLQAHGGLANSPVLVPGLPVTLATVLLPTAYMFSPAGAHVLTRILTREGWSGLGLRPRFGRRHLLAWALAWWGPPVLVVLGAALFFLVFPTAFDPTFAVFERQLEAQQAATSPGLPMAPPVLLALQVGVALVLAPWLNLVVAFGEEFGWRGYLLPKLLVITGARRAVVASGVVWGCWHWPLILMGYEYGLGSWGAPWTGLATFCLFTVWVGTFLSWLTVRSGSVWPAALAHGALNASAGLPLLALAGGPRLLLGPAPMGLVSMLPWTGVAVVILVGRFNKS